MIAVVAQGPRRYTMPDKDNPAKQIPVAPRFFLTSAQGKTEPAVSQTIPVSQRRTLVASYVTGQDNPWFAKAFINRIWYALMGETFYEPIDDIGPERTSKGAEVLDPLAEQWQKGGYDIRWLFRLILNTNAYQRRVRSTASRAGKTPFASSCPSRLRADQLFDELAHALALPLDATGNIVNPRLNPNGRGRPQAKAAFRAQLVSGQSPGNSNKSPNQPLTKGGLKKAAEAAGLAGQAVKKQGAVQRIGGPRLLFDRLFGIDPSVANEDVLGTIPQALFLMNSPMVNNRTQARPGLVLGDILNSAANERAALGELYLRVLSRQPTADEVAICGRYISSVGNEREAFEDIYWSLINTTEFLTEALIRRHASRRGRTVSATTCSASRAIRHRTGTPHKKRGDLMTMPLEKETLQIAMDRSGVIGRRQFLSTIAAGTAGLAMTGAIPVTFTDWMGYRRRTCARTRWRVSCSGWEVAEPARDLRPQARYRPWRRDEGYPDIRAGDFHRRRLGQDGQDDERNRPGALDDQQGRQPSTPLTSSTQATHPRRPSSIRTWVARSWVSWERPTLTSRTLSVSVARPRARLPGGCTRTFCGAESRQTAREHRSEGGHRSLSPPPQPARPARRSRLWQERRRGPRSRSSCTLPADGEDGPFPNMKAFHLDSEPEALRDAYGRTPFGQGCLLARRLVQAGITFIEVRLNGWDTHQQNHEKVGKLAQQVDPGFATLIHDLKQKGMLDKTLVLWMGEFGRTPKINPNAGRDHFPKVFNVALAGGGIKGGQVIGASSSDGSEVKDQPIIVPDLLASLCHSLKVNPAKETITSIGRPMKIVDGGKPVSALFS